MMVSDSTKDCSSITITYSTAQGGDTDTQESEKPVGLPPTPLASSPA